MAEAAFFPHFDGAEGSAFYGTVGGAVPVGPVTFSSVYSLRTSEGVPDDHLATLSAEFEVFDGISAGLGYRFGREGGETSHTVGALFVYEIGYPSE